MSDLLDDLLIARARDARLAIIHGERRHHFALGREDRRGPTGTQRMGQSRLAVVRPQGVACDVLHDHLFSAVCGCPAGTHGRPDHNSVDRIRIDLWKAGGATMAQAIAVEYKIDVRTPVVCSSTSRHKLSSI